jgi:hypothetical protein
MASLNSFDVVRASLNVYTRCGVSAEPVHAASDTHNATTAGLMATPLLIRIASSPSHHIAVNVDLRQVATKP